ncbi:MAPEG family protein [Jannaschia sp. Os4]|uniref:MAPEG family protein n=1 Tax=Jannaschia sp. Os4 TaxID=2807617 RepID=UPI001939F190|nr:MAPEG family protein [Jannaschia sp. Os4]MBM2576075.1 MAPEG family protein [Jannaschia sp. Os4]
MTATTALILYALISMTALTVEIVYAYATQGFGYGFSSNRPAIERTPLGLRLERAWRNQVESAAYVLAVLAAAAVTGLSGPGPALALALVVAGRALFVLLYYTGLPFARIIGFSTASLGSLYLAVTMLLG